LPQANVKGLEAWYFNGSPTVLLRWHWGGAIDFTDARKERITLRKPLLFHDLAIRCVI